ncbi:fibronectin type III domain-containing protein [Vibrio parahaemolyticus]
MGLAAATVAWISVGLSVGATIYTMTQMPDNKSNDSIAGTKVTKNGTQSPRNRVYGTAIVGCTYVYSNVLDRDQSYRLDVFSVGGVGAVRFHNVWIDDVKMFDENKNDLTDPANASSGIYDASSMRPRYKKSDGFKMQWRSGQENQVAAKLAIDNSDGEWTVNHRGACVPHIVIFADYSTNQDYVFFSDRYNINALVTGAEVFDPRTGKVDGESSNTALATLDFLMNDYYGMGVTVDYINMESFKYGATFCENNDLRINSAIDASAKFADILQDMLACCGGALAIVDGKITFLVEEKVLAPVYELDEDSILKNSLKVSPADSGSYYNVVSTTFKSEINRDNDDDFVIPQNAASDPRVMADGKIITKSLKMPYARDAYEAEDGVVQHCVKYMTNLVYNKAKFQMSCSFDIDLHEFSELRPWDVIGVSSEIYGFKNKLFRVQSMKVATDADRFNIATIHCIEYDHSVYEGTVEGTGSLPRPKPDDNVPAPKNVMFTLSSFVNTGYGLLAWEASCFTPSTAYDIEYKLSSASQWTRLTSAFRGTQFTLTDLKEARYDFRVRTYELFLGSSDWTTITNVNVRPAYVIPEVTGLKVETSTPNFKFTWDDMTNVEVDNIPSSDAPNSAGSTGKLADVFHQYSIQIVVNGVMKYATTTKESVFTLDLEKNKEMMGGQPSRVITFRISIEDRLGNSSLVTELVANNRQIGVAGDVDVTNANGSATVEWSPCFEPDFAGTEVHISTTKGFTPSASTLHATLGKESFYVFPFPDKTTRYMRIAHFDTMGRDGLQYSPEITLTYDGVESAKSVRLISDSQTFHVNKSGVAAPSLIIMSAFTQNVEGSVKWTTSPSVALATTSNPNERILKYASMGNHDSVKVTVTVDGVTDTMTICKVRDGHDGQDGQDGSNGQDGNTIYEQYRYGQVINPDASWTAWGADMRTSDIYRQTRRVINDVPQAAGRVHRIAGMDGSNGADGERLFVVYHKNPVNQRPMPPEGAGNTGGWTEDSDGANWMSQKLANTIDQPLTFWSFPIQMKGNDGEVDYGHVDEIAEAKKNEAIEASIASATASVEAAETRAKAYADGVATEAEKAAIAAADAKANAAETKAKAYADGVVTEAEQAAIAEAERLAAQAEANAKAASDPKGSATKAQQAAIAAAEEKANAAKVFAQSYADGVATEAEQTAIAAANAAANAAEEKAKAYADGEITKAEQAAITEAERLAAMAEANAKAASDPKGAAANAQSTAQAYAKAQAEAAELRAKQASDPKGSASAAQQAAIAAADAKVAAAKTAMEAYADGVANDAEQAAILAAQAKADAAEVRAKAYADGEVTKAEQAAIDEAERLAAEAEKRAKAASQRRETFYFESHYDSAVILLIPYADGTKGWGESEVFGSLTFRRGGTSSTNRTERVDVACKTAYTNTEVSGTKYGSDWNWKFCTVLFEGKKWLAIQSGNNVQDARWEFVGTRTCSTASPVGAYDASYQFKFIPYVRARDGQTTVLNQEVKDSLTYVTAAGIKDAEGVSILNATQVAEAASQASQAASEAVEVRVKAYADGVATEAEKAAIAAADAKALAAEVRAKAYADGEVTKAEQAAIAAAQEAANLAETKAKAYADGVATEAEQAAIAAADAKAKAAETRAKAYADGEVTKAEQAAIDEAERLANAAKAHADAEMKKERKRQFDPHLTDPLKTFSKAVSGSPDVISTLEGVGNISVVSGVTGGNALSLTGDHWIYSTAVIPVDPNKKYKMVVKVRQTKDKTTGGSGFYAGVVTLDRNYNNLSGGAGTHRYFCAEAQTLTVAGGWRTFEGYIQGIGDARNNFRAGTAYVRPMFIVNYSKGNGVAEVDEIRFYEVTERGDLVDLGFETTQGAQDKANAAKAAAEAYAKARAEAALGIQFTHSGYIERDGLNFRKKSNNNVWDGWASSKQTFTGGCSVTFTAGTTNVGAMCGITTPNMGGASYTDIDFCFYLRGSGILGIYENGKNIGDFGNYAVGTILTIRYDGLKVRYYVNGVLKREVGTSANLGFVADMSIYNVSTAFPIQGLTFTDAEGSAALAKAAEDAAKAAAQQNLDNRIPQSNADALKTMMSNEGLRYYRKITVGGEANKYYPVIIHGGSQDKLRTIKIWRSYAETAPNSWHNSTHKGALMLTWQGNFGGWGGATYRSTILEHSEAYSTIFADCYIVNHSMGFAFFLRGGGAVYHIASDMDIAGVERTNPSGGGSGIYLDGTLNSYVHATSPYNAPDALTAVNSTRINDLKTAYNGKGQYIKNLNADNITAGKIAAQYVHADVYNGTLVNATNIKAGMLDADHINTRTFTGENAIFDAEVYGGVLTGAVVRTGSTGARAEMREDGYKFAAYNAQNKPTFYVDANGNVVMNSGSISSDVLSEASRNSNIVTWIGTAGKGGNMQFTDNLALQNDVTYFPITNNYYTTGKNGTLNIQYCAANGYLFQDEKSAVGAAAPAQKTLPADAAPTIYFVDASNTTKGAVIRMTIKYTTQAANGTAASKTNPSGTQGWRKTYAHFHIDNVATRPNVAAGTNVKGYKLCINLGASSIKDKLKALKRVPDVITYSEVAEGGRYLPHSYKLVWSGAANSVPNSWGSGWYMVQGHDRGDWHDAGFIFVLDENHYGTAAPRSIFPAYSIYYEYRYDTKIFKSSSGNITRIFKLTGV